MPEREVTEDALLGGAVRLLQVRTGHRAGTDAVLLAGLCDARPGDRVVDLGAASGAVGLMVAARVPVGCVTFVERDPDLAALCERNAALNGLADRATATALDVLAGAPPADLAGSADLVATNPPFFDEASPASPDPGRRAAHAMAAGGLAGWTRFAGALLKHRGRIAMIHRADALAACLAALGDGFGSVVVVPVYPRAGRCANRVVLTAVKAGRAPMRIRPGLFLHDDEGPTPEGTALHGRPAPPGAET